MRYESLHRHRIAAVIATLQKQIGMNLVMHETKENDTLDVIVTTARSQKPRVSLPIRRYSRLRWGHIVNAMKHELYEKIATALLREMALMSIRNTTNTTIDAKLNVLQVKTKIGQNELKYIKNLISRAFYFEPITAGIILCHYANHLVCFCLYIIIANKILFIEDNCIQEKQYINTHTDIDDNFVGFDANILYDIYNVHNCFLISNYQFTQYDKNRFVQDIEDNNYFNSNGKNAQFIDKIRALMYYKYTPQINLCPQFIIDDNMYDIWSYFFAASHLINKVNTIDNDGEFILKVCIIPNKIVSIYDEGIAFSYDIDDVGGYLESKNIVSSTFDIFSSNFDVSTITNIFVTQHSILKIKQSQMSHLLIVIDRRSTDDGNGANEEVNKVYMVVANEHFNNLCKLNQNYFISLQFSITREGIVRCHLFYGLGNMRNMRFYPEHLKNIVPRLFKRDSELSNHDNMEKRYDDQYKHGFAVNLNDPIFNKYYKIITKWEHISVNYNRDIVKKEQDDDEKEYEYKNTEYHKFTKMNTDCSYNKPLEIAECPLIRYIIDALVEFQTNLYIISDVNSDKLNLQYLSKCYDHIICVHSFCLNDNRRKEIVTFISGKVGKCKMGQNCHVIRNHSSQIREGTELNQSDECVENGDNVLKIDILESCLDSLHCYLLHADDQLHRTYRNDKDQPLRFRSHEDPLQFTDDIDAFIEFIRQMTNDSKLVSRIMNWIYTEEYDWESLSNDIDCNIDTNTYQSNLYLFLLRHKKPELFKVLFKFVHDRCYIENDDENREDNNINAISFGVSVLNWLEYGDEPNHENFMDEMIHCKYSKITETLLERYVNQCLLKINSAESIYKFTLNEMLSIKIYTDTTELCTIFRKAHWNNRNTMQMKKEFYWWSITIYKASLYHARLLPRFDVDRDEPMMLYHGINTVLAVNQTLPKYHGPVSTSLVNTVARQFSSEQGLLWCIKTSYDNPFSSIVGIDVSWISCHKEESELLLVNEYLHIDTTMDFSDCNIKINHLLFKLQIYQNKIIDTKQFWNQMGFTLNPVLIAIIKQHPSLLCLTESISKDGVKQTILDRLINELNISELGPWRKVAVLFERLKTDENKIMDTNEFWNSLGFALDDELISLMKQHPPLLLQPTSALSAETEKRIVLDRLIEELHIYPLLHWYRISNSNFKFIGRDLLQTVKTQEQHHRIQKQQEMIMMKGKKQ